LNTNTRHGKHVFQLKNNRASESHRRGGCERASEGGTAGASATFPNFPTTPVNIAFRQSAHSRTSIGEDLDSDDDLGFLLRCSFPFLTNGMPGVGLLIWRSSHRMLSQLNDSSDTSGFMRSKTADNTRLRCVQCHHELHQGPLREAGRDPAIWLNPSCTLCSKRYSDRCLGTSLSVGTQDRDAVRLWYFTASPNLNQLTSLARYEPSTLANYNPRYQATWHSSKRAARSKGQFQARCQRYQSTMQCDS
jgi:hypothetical protein